MLIESLILDFECQYVDPKTLTRHKATVCLTDEKQVKVQIYREFRTSLLCGLLGQSTQITEKLIKSKNILGFAVGSQTSTFQRLSVMLDKAEEQEQAKKLMIPHRTNSSDQLLSLLSKQKANISLC